MTKAEIEAALENRKIFRRVFCGSQEGKDVLVWFLNQCGYYSADPQLVDPVLIALANRVLSNIGVVHAENLFDDIGARLGTANDRDIETMKIE
jgi:hypothetical protein